MLAHVGEPVQHVLMCVRIKIICNYLYAYDLHLHPCALICLIGGNNAILQVNIYIDVCIVTFPSIYLHMLHATQALEVINYTP